MVLGTALLQFEPSLVSHVYDLLFSQESPENPDGQKHISSSGSLGSAPHTPLFSQGGSQILSKLHRNKTKFVSVCHGKYFTFYIFVSICLLKNTYHLHKNPHHILVDRYRLHWKIHQKYMFHHSNKGFLNHHMDWLINFLKCNKWNGLYGVFWNLNVEEGLYHIWNSTYVSHSYHHKIQVDKGIHSPFQIHHYYKYPHFRIHRHGNDPLNDYEIRLVKYFW